MIYLAIFLFVLMLFALNSINWYQYFEGFLARYGYSIDSLTKETEYKKIVLIVFGLGFCFGSFISILIYF